MAIWGEEDADFKDGFNGLPLERMIGEERVRGKGDFAPEGVRFVSDGESGESKEEDEGKGTEPSPGKLVGRDRKSGGGMPSSSSFWSSFK